MLLEELDNVEDLIEKPEYDSCWNIKVSKPIDQYLFGIEMRAEQN